MPRKHLPRSFQEVLHSLSPWTPLLGLNLPIQVLTKTSFSVMIRVKRSRHGD